MSTVPDAGPAESPEFAEYINYLAPIAHSMARRRSRPHALLSPEDQAAYALEVCLRVWLHYQHRLPPQQMYPIAVTAMDRRLRHRMRSAVKLGEAEVTIISLDAPLRARHDDNGSSACVGDRVSRAPAAAAPEVTTLWAVSRVDVLRPLSDDEWVVLREVVRPSRATLTAARKIWQNDLPRLRRWNWPNARARAVAAGLRWRLDRVRATWRRVRQRVREHQLDGGCCGEVEIRDLSGSTRRQPRWIEGQ